MPRPQRHYEIVVTEIKTKITPDGPEPERIESIRHELDAVDPWQAVQDLAEQIDREANEG